MKVLVADDSGVIRCVIKRALYELGIEEIDEAANGAEGVCLIKHETYDLIVTDWNMSPLSGLDLVKAARAEGQTCPIVMQTTEAQKAQVLTAIAAGVNDYVLKPFTKEVILQRLDRFVSAIRVKQGIHPSESAACMPAQQNSTTSESSSAR